MKKFIFLFLLFLFFTFFITDAEEVSYYELSNHKECMNCAKEIASKIPLDEIAVINKGNSVLCGMKAEKNLTDNERSNAEEIIKSYFPKVKKLRVEADNKRARNIIELSYYSSGKIKKSTLRKRFNYLLFED